MVTIATCVAWSTSISVSAAPPGSPLPECRRSSRRTVHRTPRRRRSSVVCASQDASSDDPPPTPTILTDSVLETKWKNERLNNPTTSPATPPSTPDNITDFHPSALDCRLPDSDGCAVDDGKHHDYHDDLIASDPYKAFSKFTKIAAPTVPIGRVPSASYSPSSSSSSPTAAVSQPATTSPGYSTGDIAKRLVHYTHAQNNLRDFIALFVGDFDNGLQTRTERLHGVYPGEGGGHEHIHCRIRCVTDNLLFAMYYFNGDPGRIFRTRIYALDVRQPVCERGLIEMRILRLYEEYEQQLASVGYDVDRVDSSFWTNAAMYTWLQGCEVFWEKVKRNDAPVPSTTTAEDGDDDDFAVRCLGIASGARFIGYMIGGGCEVYSREVGDRIRILDDLLLTRRDLWVADRGFDRNDKFIYGNRKGIPYKMRRVAPTADDPLSWTLSPKLSPPPDYIP